MGSTWRSLEGGEGDSIGSFEIPTHLFERCAIYYEGAVTEIPVPVRGLPAASAGSGTHGTAPFHIPNRRIEFSIRDFYLLAGHHLFRACTCP